jgi:hypothetical protein
MTTNDLETGVERTPETSCVSNIPLTMDSVQHTVLIGPTLEYVPDSFLYKLLN